MKSNEWINDCNYECDDCEEEFKVFSKTGLTNFCPNCGSNNITGKDDS